MKGDARSIRAKKNVLQTVLIKGLGVIIGFLYFPLSLDYLGTVKFGIYLTLLSIVDWFLNFDVGIGLGLRNKFGESVARGDDEDAIRYVSTAYFALGAMITLVTLFLLILNFTLPWTDWINISADLKEEVVLLGAVIILAFGIRFVARNVYEIFFAMQQMAYVEFFTFLTKLSFLALILVLPFIVSDSLFLFGTAKALTFAIVPLAVGLFYFNRKYQKYKPRLKYVRKDYFKSLFSLGTKFFLIKIAMLIIHQTNNILIASFVSLEGVPQYEAAYKYLSIFMLLFVILNNQLWPSNIEAYAKGEFEWMKKSIRGVVKIWLATVALALVMVLVSPIIYRLWLQDGLTVPMEVSIAVAISICLTTWVNMFNIVLNGTGKIKLQMYAWLFAALINIPASIFFVRVLDLGVVGIVLGTVASLVPLVVISPIQVNKILAKTDKGIWAK
ncbi:oligosaccharide flippase family protein [Zobellia galactanivorans]|uniref:lipopolysaccharide biosynthesis protein n=1 Tax=Zobellia galactanivorans (strain DSM 12802 / CCUG 47099 / CIP 106680 / NCIMB 13871 / Dsij) TaxID=63186 RepID=UPI0026E474EA|nr:oligosaccharide flippase family protein [Zobellia galactanivorans]MDO6809965.1 oligosaccharide flippase family protein [Zobellia galactanivorans]